MNGSKMVHTVAAPKTMFPHRIPIHSPKLSGRKMWLLATMKSTCMASSEQKASSNFWRR